MADLKRASRDSERANRLRLKVRILDDLAVLCMHHRVIWCWMIRSLRM
jgi:hypothetical protein